MNSSQAPDELRLLIESMFEHDLIDADRVRLNELLRTSPPSRQFYISYLGLHSELCWSAVPQNLMKALEGPSAEAALQPSAEATQGQLAGECEADLPDRPYRRPVVFKGLSPLPIMRQWPTLWATLAVAVLVYGTFVLLSFDLLRKPQGPHGLAGTDDDPAAQGLEVPKTPESDPLIAQLVAKPGVPQQITSGIASLALDGGATLFIEGPAEWVIDGPNDATLESGKLVAHVPFQARGFTLKTPTARIVDLGTEFGVQTGADQPTDILVFQGDVNVEPISQGPHRPNNDAGESPRRLSAGMSLRVQPTDGQKFEAAPLEFDRAPFRSLLTSRSRPDAAELPVIAYEVPVDLPLVDFKFQASEIGLGMDFDVLSPICVTRLGVYVWKAVGIAANATMTVEIWERDNGGTPHRPKDDRGVRVVAGQAFTTASPGELIGSSRFLPLAEPVRLEPGSYTVVAYGFSGANQFANSCGLPPRWRVHDGNRRLQFIGSSRYGPEGEFPQTVEVGAPNAYAAGTFEFVAAES